ncbi:MerR family transcriptional regulator [Microvirga brassicacearum]|uniref:Helix-turn-helix domain-containing protein n=1 Tax=Microvirga brassicacearum TaxID=2580413 RepID=A0A5N3P803_9HYPH|nr:helix-turn-helix domain-containing protein [Microvirga brassicacearum]KAB0265815.1 helix-turn-helix domain-containing protein [Microvirga brassicacearum]
MSDLSIGELSRRVHVKVPTIRYYEQIGLLPPPPRTEGRQRRYGPAELDRLGFIRHARDLGFEIEAIRELLGLSEQPDGPCEPADQIVTRHLAAVERRIAHLTALRTELRRMLKTCDHGQIRECRIIQVLGDHELCGADHIVPAQV